MNVGTRQHSALRLGRAALLSMSVIALAMACFPVLAHAESASGVQYSDAIPKAEGENPSHRKQQTPAKSSSTGNGGKSDRSTDTDGSKEAGSDGSESSATQAAGGGAGSNGGTGQGSPATTGKGGADSAVQAGGRPASSVSASKSDDGSSPLVPILIAIAVLAAASVAVVMMRQRRQRRGPTATASPEAN